MPPDPDPLSCRQSATPQTSALLLAFATHHTRERVSLRYLARLLGNRSFGLLLLLFTPPNTLPMIGTTPTGVRLAVAVTLVALGLIETDGIFVAAGWVIGALF